MVSSSPRQSPSIERNPATGQEEDGSDNEQVLKRGIEKLAEDNVDTPPLDERALRIQHERDSLLERLRATEMQRSANASPSVTHGSSSTDVEARSGSGDSLVSALNKANEANAAEDPTQSARRVKPRLDDTDQATDAANGLPSISTPIPVAPEEDTVMAEPSDPTHVLPAAPILNGGSDATAGGASPANAPGETNSASPVPTLDEPTGPRTSSAAGKRRRKAKEVEPAGPSPARQTRSRARAANISTTASSDSNAAINAGEPNQVPSNASQASQAAQASLSASTADPTIDPSLMEQDSPNKPSASTSTSAQSAAGAPGTSSNSPANGVNPYLSLFFPKTNPSGGTPTPTSAHPMPFGNPYMFYPMTPVTPNSPGYPYNPYLYMPMMPGYPPPGAPQPPANSPATPSSSTHSAPPQPLPAQPQPPAAPAPKPKRTKAHPVSSKSFSIPLVPRDKQGKPMLPLNVGIMTVISLGSVCPREHFHTERYIFPVGYEVTRRYLSTIDPSIEVVYHCTILDGGDGPKFQIVPSDTPDKPVIAGTATGAWSSIVKQANAIRNRQHSNSVSGPDFFGLGQNTIKHLIQELPGADKLKNYVWQYFIEGGPLGGRHASVIPALPEEYDASIPRGPVYHTPLEREKLKMTVGNASPGEMPKGLSHYPQHIIAQAQTSQPQAGPSHAPGPPPHVHTTSPPPLPPPHAPMPTAGLQTIPSIIAVNPVTIPPSQSPCSVGTPSTSPPPHPPHVTLAAPGQRPAHRKSASAQVQQIQALAQTPSTNGHSATFIPSAGQPTPITPNTPAPSIASIMNAYRPAAP